MTSRASGWRVGMKVSTEVAVDILLVSEEALSWPEEAWSSAASKVWRAAMAGGLGMERINCREWLNLVQLTALTIMLVTVIVQEQIFHQQRFLTQHGKGSL